MQLLVINYSMNSSSQIFSHQRRIVSELSKRVEKVDVITSEEFTDLPINNVHVFSTNWRIGKTFRNLRNFYSVAIPLLLKHRGGIVFSHMTDTQSALIAIPCRILRIRHVLWYAHKSASLFVRLSFPLINVMTTSTPGSCPFSGRKVVALGQAIDASIAKGVSRLPDLPPRSWYHIGRIDPSKNIEKIIQAIEVLHNQDSKIQLHFYGAPSSKKHEQYFHSLKTNYAHCDWITFHGQISSADLAEVSSHHDGFIHAFWGSLDKALLEAIMLKRVVVSANPEFLSQFENRNVLIENIGYEIQTQLEALYSAPRVAIQADIERRLALVLAIHELKGWIDRLLTVLQGSKELP